MYFSTCKNGGNWACAYNFAYCPYFCKYINLYIYTFEYIKYLNYQNEKIILILFIIYSILVFEANKCKIERHLAVLTFKTCLIFTFTDCGNQIYNPSKQICCCGKVHPKKRYHACCGYFYYDARYSQCCNYFSVKPKKAKCPRYRI